MRGVQCRRLDRIGWRIEEWVVQMGGQESGYCRWEGRIGQMRIFQQGKWIGQMGGQECGEGRQEDRERGRDGDYVAKGRRLGIITLNGINRILHPTSPLSQPTNQTIISAYASSASSCLRLHSILTPNARYATALSVNRLRRVTSPIDSRSSGFSR